MKPEQKAAALLGDFKGRLSPYIKAMKERGYFGEAVKLKAQQQAQVENEHYQYKNAHTQQAKQGQAKPARPIKPEIGIDPAVANPGKPSDLNHGVDLPSGDYLSVSKEVKPDGDSQESRAPDVTAAVRPKPPSGNDGFS